MPRPPSLFISHGAPTYALQPGLAGQQLGWAGTRLPRPPAVLIVSPHWSTSQPRVSTTAVPEVVHDFGGFDPALYDVRYPAPGHPALAALAVDALRQAGWPARADEHRGLDHGAWVPLLHLYPEADVPVFQVSMPVGLTADAALEFGRALRPLADAGVMVVGSGSLTHNLYEFRQAGSPEAAYAHEFTGWIREAVLAGHRGRLLRALDVGPHARRAHPTPEHFLPLLIAWGAAPEAPDVTVLPGGMAHGVLSMESYIFGTRLQGIPVSGAVS